MYKSNLCISKKSDFSSFLIKEVKFRPIKMSQQVYLLFLRMYSKHRELKKLQSKTLPCAMKFVSTCSHHHNFANHIGFEIFLHSTNLYLNVEQERRFSRTKEH